MSRACHICKKIVELVPHRAARSDYVCRPCYRQRHTEYMRRKRNSSPQPPRLPADLARTQMLARVQTRLLIRRGKMVRQPCEVCGATPAEAHHDDYGKPRDVRWLCPPHHREHHRKLRSAA
jgi:hypothetical protein